MVELTLSADRSRIAGDVDVLAVDWGKERRKRVVYAALHDTQWIVRKQDSPEDGWTLPAVLSQARSLLARRGKPVLVAIDVVLGLPAAYTQSTPCAGFLDALVWLERSGGLDAESSSAETWSSACPFFRVPPGGRTAFETAAGGRAGLLREIEIATGGNPVFCLSGIPGTVGSGSRALWKELAPLLHETRDFEIWPFEGDLVSLTSAPRIVLAELYPRAAYALALSRDLPARMLSIGKTLRDHRVMALEQLMESSWIREMNVDLCDTNPALESEDCFDALLSAAALVRLISARAPISCDLIDSKSEGGILPTGMLELARRTRLAAPVSRRDSASQPLRETEIVKPEPEAIRCPIPGCSKTYRSGRLGWDGHVGSFRQHPDWYPEIVDAEERKTLFRKTFSAWLGRR